MGTRHERLKNYKAWGLDWRVIDPPAEATRAAEGFFEAWARANALMAFVLRLVGHVDQASKAAREALVEIGIRNGSEPLRSPFEDLRPQTQTLSELLLGRHVDNYLTYLSEILFEGVREESPRCSSPRTRPSTMATLMGQSSIADAVRVIAERRSSGALVQNHSATSGDTSRSEVLPLGLPEDKPILTEIIETRNISVHNRCMINRRYVEQVAGTSAERINQGRSLSLGEIESFALFFGDLVADFDGQARAHWGLDVHPLRRSDRSAIGDSAEARSHLRRYRPTWKRRVERPQGLSRPTYSGFSQPPRGADSTSPPRSMNAFCSECRAYLPMDLVHVVPVTIGTPVGHEDGRWWRRSGWRNGRELRRSSLSVRADQC